MENLDELMRKKFDTDDPAGRFEFREEYWEQAQALLETEEKRRRKRRRWLFWWVLLAAAVAVGGGLWTWDREQSQTVPANEPGNNAHSLSGGIKGTRTQGGDIGQATNSGEKTTGTDAALWNNNTENQGAGEKNGDNETTTAPTRQTEKGSEKPGTPQPPTLQKPTPLRPNGNGNPVRPSPDRPEVQSKKDEQSHRGAEQADNLSPLHRADSANETAVAQSDAYDWNNFPSLPTLSELLELPARPLDTPFATPYVRPIQPVRKQTFSFGLAAAGTLSQASPDGKRIGAAGGLFAQYGFSAAWSMTAGAQWRFLPGTWVNDTAETISEQLLYSFGYQQDTWELETRGLHFLEIPIGLQWRRGAFAAEGGFTPGFLLGVQGRLTQQHSESLQEGVSTDNSRVWLNKTPYYKFSPAIFLGGEWLATPRLGVSLRGTYRPGSFGEKLIPDEPPPVNLFWLDAGLRWYF